MHAKQIGGNLILPAFEMVEYVQVFQQGLPEPEDVEINLKPDDYRLDKFCASGPGGRRFLSNYGAL